MANFPISVSEVQAIELESRYCGRSVGSRLAPRNAAGSGLAILEAVGAARLRASWTCPHTSTRYYSEFADNLAGSIGVWCKLRIPEVANEDCPLLQG